MQSVERRLDGLVRDCRSVLVTGGAGFIGSHLVDRLISDGHEVRVLDNLSTGSLKNVERHMGRKEFQFMKADITNTSALRKALKGVDAVFHEAAIVSVVLSVSDPILINEVNTTGTLKVLKASADAGVRRLVYASSCANYGEQGKARIKEDSPLRPMSPYAVSKLAAEKYCLTFSELGRLETVCLRYFNVYGPRQRLSPYSGVITIFQDRLRRNQPPIIYGNGKQTRDFVNVSDIVEANMLALNVERATGEVFNIGTGLRTSLRALAEMIVRTRKGSKLRPIYAPPRLGDIEHSCADIGKARRILGYSPSMTLHHYINCAQQNHVRANASV